MTEYAVYADNRETLKAHIRTFRSTFRCKPGAPTLQITLPCCGEIQCYRQEIELPVNDVGPCPCGNWFIKYKEQPLRVVF